MNIKHYNDIPGLVDHITREEMVDYGAQNLQDQDIAIELGCFLGSTITRLAQQIKDRGISVRVFAIDNWEFENISDESFAWSKIDRQDDYYDKFQANLSDLDLVSDIATIRSDTTLAAKQFEDGSVNYLFMDAAHGYQGVRDELKDWLPKMHERCLMFIHDFSTACIANAVKDEFGEVLDTTSNKHTGIIKNSL